MVRAGSTASYQPLRSHSVRKGDIGGIPPEFHRVKPSVRRREAFRPLELSIYYKPENRLSSLFSLFGGIESSEDPTSPTSLARSPSGLSFAIRRKAVGAKAPPPGRTSPFAVEAGMPDAQQYMAVMDGSMPRSPPAAFVRPAEVEYESPTYTRVKSAMYEKLELDQRLKELDQVIEQRRSRLYMNSRPNSRMTSSTSAGRPSTSGRTTTRGKPVVVSSLPRPRSKLNCVLVPTSASTAGRTQRSNMHSAQRAPTANGGRPLPKSGPNSLLERPLPRTPKPPPLLKERPLPPPPLPLILQNSNPPPRKRSLSRVSGWLRLSGGPEAHSRQVSLESVTNTPKPVTPRQGFYQCIDVDKEKHLESSDSVNTSSSSGLDSEGKGTVQSTTSPESSPEKVPVKRATKFLGKEISGGREDSWSPPQVPVPLGHGRDSVGVAF